MLVQEFPDILASLMRKLQTICLWPGNKVELGMRLVWSGNEAGLEVREQSTDSKWLISTLLPFASDPPVLRPSSEW